VLYSSATAAKINASSGWYGSH